VLTSSGAPFISIEHVGSTSVPGLAAKPVIDCDIVVHAEDVQPASEALTDAGFVELGELGIPQRWAFKEPPRLADSNVYVIVEGSLALRDHLAVRDLLRSDSVRRDEYGEIKKKVGATARDIDEYGSGKNAAVQQILAAAGLSEEDRRAIDNQSIPSHAEFPR